MPPLNFKKPLGSAVSVIPSRPTVPAVSKIIEPVISDKPSYIRAMFMGFPHSGKTTAALSFPNPMVIDFDNKLPANTPHFPFYNESWVRSTFPEEDHSGGVNRRDALLSFLRTSMSHYEGKTLILDSWTLVMSAYSAYVKQHLSQYISKESGSYDGRKMFLEKLELSAEIITMLSGHQGHVIVICHTQIDRDDKGKPSGTYRPNTTGGFKDVMSGYFNTALFVEYKREYESLYPSTAGHVFLVKPTANFKPMLPPDSPTPTVAMIPATYMDLMSLLSQPVC